MLLMILRLVNNAKDFLKYISKSTYITHKIMLLFMKLNQFKYLTNQFMLNLMF